ncbi:ATP-binding response regulator [Pseudoalteromonas sp. KJ10-2]|uniref:ATP-binding response regulator n=1 Tax=Psychromonas sp. KJ10-2 TaxID=3391822 RepID=UPI0039B6835D
MTFCPAYGKAICSLCCSLDVRCADQCRPHATISQQAHDFFTRFVSEKVLKMLTTPLTQFIALTLVLSLISATILFLVYLQVPLEDEQVKQVFANTLIKTFFLLIIIIGIISWLFILARDGNQNALKELRSQTKALAKEVDAHETTSSALQNAKEIAESANQAKSRYLAALSHELRTPLNVLLGYAQLLLRDQALPPKQQETIAIIRRNGQHLADLIESLLEISKIEAGRVTLQRDEFNLKAILQQLVDMFQMQASKKGIKFNYISSPNLPDYVATDKQRFRQILINLISNAIKFTEQGSVTFKVTYRSEVASFSVIDTGAGIALDDQEIIFKPFEQIRHSQSQSTGGTGLGLTISRSLAELMGGEITLNSQLGKGSTFNFRLMLFKLHKDPKEPELTKSEAIGYDGPIQSILVVDDNLNQRELMADLLSPIGFNILLAEDAEQGYQQLQQQKVDLILMDVQMPNINGWQMVKTLREQHFHMPILMLSANARDAEYNQQAEGYHDGYIAKPLNLDALLGKIAQLLDLQWQYKRTDNQLEDKQTQDHKPNLGTEQYEALIAMAEIGYLSGFKHKFDEIKDEYCYPAGSESQIIEYVEVCNFPKIIEYLNELNDGS